MATWQEIFKAALQTNKEFLTRVIDLQEKEDLISPNKTARKTDVSKEISLKFNVSTFIKNILYEILSNFRFFFSFVKKKKKLIRKFF